MLLRRYHQAQQVAKPVVATDEKPKKQKKGTKKEK